MKREIKLNDAATVFVSPAPSNHQLIEQAEAWLIENCESEMQAIYKMYMVDDEDCEDLEAFLSESRIELLAGGHPSARFYKAKFNKAMAALSQKFSYLCQTSIDIDDECTAIVRSATPLMAGQYFDIGPSTYLVHRAAGTPFLPPLDSL